jgi:glycosyltransferase involved in cell wall biosynthesis
MIEPDNPDFTNTPASPQRPYFAYAPADPSAAPAVSIVTPFYNTGAIFHETARSIVQQSLQQWEWLIVNDGSTEAEALSILEEYRHGDPRIHVIDHEQNRGLSAARNTGYAAARAEFVIQLDSDDLLEPTAAEKWLWCLTSYPEYSFVNGYSLGFGAEEYVWQKGFHLGNEFLERNLINPNIMVRKSVHAAVGGYDETMRQGLEDWDFWLHCADAGYWGQTIPEYLTWYRRRPSHGDRWHNLESDEQMFAFRDAVLRERYPRLWEEGGFPQVEIAEHRPFDPLSADVPVTNLLGKDHPRLLMILPWLHWGGADKFNLDLVRGLSTRGWEITIATTLKGDQSWLPQFAACTPDVFILDHFLRLVDYPRFLRYLITSRQPDAVLISHSEFGYRLLPYLRSYFPQLPILNYCHIEEEQWKGGGYPRMSVDYQAWLNLTVVSSQHLKDWMVQRGADGNQIRVCHTNIDPYQWRPDAALRQDVRRELGLDESQPVILFAGRLVAQKQPQVLAEALLRLYQQGLPFTALIAGDGESEAWLRSFTEEQAFSDRVRMLGGVSEQRIRELAAAADIFFLPSAWEGISLAIYEAMASGLPVVSADVGGQRELVTPECGFLIARSDAESEAEQYATILAELIRSPEQRAAMGRAGRERVLGHFRLDEMVDTMESLVGEAQTRAPALVTLLS